MSEPMRAARRRPRLIVPVVLAVTVVGALAGCGTDKPKVDAGHDAPTDTPII